VTQDRTLSALSEPLDGRDTARRLVEGAVYKGESCSVHVCGSNLTISSPTGEVASIPVRNIVARFEQDQRGFVCSLADWSFFLLTGLKHDDDLTRTDRVWRLEMTFAQALAFRRHVEKLGVVQTDLPKQFKFKKRIGKGAFSEVYLAQHVDTRATVAAKVIKKPVADADLNLDTPVWDEFVDEVRILAMAQGHENILKLHATYLLRTEDEVYGLAMITEHLPLTLLDLVKEHGNLPEAATRGVTESLLRALAHLNSVGLAHRDIKTSNVMLRSLVNGGIVLVDYGFGRIVQGPEVYPSMLGTLGYFAPEMFVEGALVDPRSTDVFSVGIVAMTCLTGRSIFDAKAKDGSTDPAVQYRKNKECVLNWAALAQCMSDSGLHAMRELVEKDPKKRPLAAQALRSQWYDLTFEDCVQGTLPPSTELELADLTSPRPLLRAEKKEAPPALKPTPPPKAPARPPRSPAGRIITRKTGSGNSPGAPGQPENACSLRTRTTIA
jgi:serine/threonine protein kinase